MSKLVLFSFLGLLFFLDGCSEKTMEVITDSDTKIDVGKVQNITSDMTIVHPMYDEMDRGNHDFYDKDVVVDTKYYEVNQIERGDIIAYTKDNNNFHGVTRVIALPGEKVKIVKGQFYINGKKLDTFYGRAHRVGLDLDALRKRLEQGNFDGTHVEQNVKNMIDYFEDINKKEINVSEGHVYVIGDDWFRSAMRGLLPNENIMGKVLGYR